MLSEADLQKYLPQMLRVAGEAKKFKAAGAHYLWGAQGDGTAHILTPDRKGPPDSNTFMRCATLWAGNPASGVCAGRSGADDVKRKPHWDGNPGTPAASCLWPRYFTDTSTDNSPKENGGQGFLVWGEDCNGKAHFDCAGFVRQCFRLALGEVTIPYAGLLMRSVAEQIWTAGSTPITSVKLYPADLLYDNGYTHVGIATGDASLTGVTDAGNAIHCYSATNGVVMTPVDKFVTWKYAYRWPKWGG
jgi:cell wall-associated NlpC family hydrolase